MLKDIFNYFNKDNIITLIIVLFVFGLFFPILLFFAPLLIGLLIILNFGYKYFSKDLNYDLIGSNFTVKKIENKNYNLEINKENIEYILSYHKYLNNYTKNIKLKEFLINDFKNKEIKLKIKNKIYTGKILKIINKNDLIVFNVNLNDDLDSNNGNIIIKI